MNPLQFAWWRITRWFHSLKWTIHQRRGTGPKERKPNQATELLSIIWWFGVCAWKWSAVWFHNQFKTRYRRWRYSHRRQPDDTPDHIWF